MTAPTETPTLAVVRTTQDRTAMDARLDAHVRDLRMRNAMVAQIRGSAWGLGIDSRVTKAVANYCLDMGLDPVRHVEVLGGRIYLTAEFYEERGAPLIRSGQVIPHEPEFINVDPRLDELIAGDDEETAAWARKEKGRRARARIEHNAPDAAVSTCVKRLTIAATGQTVVGVNWCGGGTRKKLIKDRNTGERKEIDADPIGDLEPTKTSITRASRRAWRQVAEVIVDYGRQVRPIEARAEIINDDLTKPAQLAAGDVPTEPAAEEPAPAAAPEATADAAADVPMLLEEARAITIPGKPGEAWGKHAGKRLDECRNSLLNAIGRWCKEQLTLENGFAGAEKLMRGCRAVLNARDLGKLVEPPKPPKAEAPASPAAAEPTPQPEPAAAGVAVNANDGLPGADDELPF